MQRRLRLTTAAAALALLAAAPVTAARNQPAGARMPQREAASTGWLPEALQICGHTGRPRWQCCASKASPMPPCCQKGCTTAGRIVR